MYCSSKKHLNCVNLRKLCKPELFQSVMLFCLREKNQLEGLSNLMGLCSCSNFIQDWGFKRCENYTIKLSAREKKWTGKAARSCFSILKIFI